RDVIPPATLSPHATETVEVEIRNDGSQTAHAFQVRMQLEYQGALLDVAPPRTVGVLGAGQTTTVPFEVTLPDLPPNTTGTLVVTLDALDEVDEFNEDNNLDDYTEIQIAAPHDAFEAIEESTGYIDLG